MNKGAPGGWTRKTGRLLDRDLPSRFLGGSRRVQVYLPPSYHARRVRRFPVLYLHDGQNVFSFAGADTTFGWGSWELDLTADTLCGEMKMQEIIMIAVDNSPTRLEEYNGRHHAGKAAKTAFEDYESFLIGEVKPLIDREFRTQAEATHTAVMGSSMGGVCSLALAWDHPEVFGAVACLSGAFTTSLASTLKGYAGPPKPFRIYLDSGVVASGGGDDGRSNTRQVVAELRRIGWKANDVRWFVDKKRLTRSELPKSGLRREKWAEAQTNQHNEFYWRRRAWRALTFLFPPRARS